MLYQLSYLGAAGPKGLRAPGYSQTKRACPPGYACGFAGRGPVLRESARRAKGREINGFSPDWLPEPLPFSQIRPRASQPHIEPSS
jgi:hypothetical protein